MQLALDMPAPAARPVDHALRVRQRLTRLEPLVAAGALTVAEVRMWQTVVPQMFNWLDEGDQAYWRRAVLEPLEALAR